MRFIESEIQSKMVSALKKCNSEVLNIHGHAEQASGWPDLYVSHTKFHGWVELKVDGNQCSVLQRKRLQSLRAKGTKAMCLRYLNDEEQFVVDSYAWDEEEKENFLRKHPVGILGDLCPPMVIPLLLRAVEIPWEWDK